MKYDNYGYGAYDSNLKVAVNKILQDYELAIEELKTIISDLENERDDLKEEIENLKDQMSYMKPCSDYEITGLRTSDF